MIQRPTLARGPAGAPRGVRGQEGVRRHRGVESFGGHARSKGSGSGNVDWRPMSTTTERLRRMARASAMRKGRASYYDVVVDGRRNEAVARHRPKPSPAAGKIKDRVAFWHGVEVGPAS